MGAHSWVRDEKRSGKGKTFVAGAAVVVPTQQPPTKKRKLVWQREASAPAGLPADDAALAPSEANEQHGPAQITEPRNGASAAAKAPANSAASAAALKAVADKKAELEKLRRQLEERKRSIQKSAAAAKEAEKQRQQAEEVEREARKRKLEAGFASAFAAAKDSAAAEIASSRTQVTFADQAEVERVLAASSDYAVLRLAPGADAAAVRRRYREMAVQLHPDKCNVARAADAFHRLVKSYQQLSKYAK